MPVPLKNLVESPDSVGPIARTVRDAAIVLGAGRDRRPRSGHRGHSDEIALREAGATVIDPAIIPAAWRSWSRSTARTPTVSCATCRRTGWRRCTIWTSPNTCTNKQGRPTTGSPAPRGPTRCCDGTAGRARHAHNRIARHVRPDPRRRLRRRLDARRARRTPGDQRPGRPDLHVYGRGASRPCYAYAYAYATSGRAASADHPPTAPSTSASGMITGTWSESGLGDSVRIPPSRRAENVLRSITTRGQRVGRVDPAGAYW